MKSLAPITLALLMSASTAYADEKKEVHSNKANINIEASFEAGNSAEAIFKSLTDNGMDAKNAVTAMIKASDSDQAANITKAAIKVAGPDKASEITKAAKEALQTTKDIATKEVDHKEKAKESSQKKSDQRDVTDREESNKIVAHKDRKVLKGTEVAGLDINALEASAAGSESTDTIRNKSFESKSDLVYNAKSYEVAQAVSP